MECKGRPTPITATSILRDHQFHGNTLLSLGREAIGIPLHEALHSICQIGPVGRTGVPGLNIYLRSLPIQNERFTSIPALGIIK